MLKYTYTPLTDILTVTLTLKLTVSLTFTDSDPDINILTDSYFNNLSFRFN